jgi:hypothetical protein
MSFCGTPDLNRRLRMVGFSMHCSGLCHRLMDLKYKRDNIDKTPAGDQIRMFYLTTEDREDFRKFAANLRWLIAEHAVTTTEEGVTSESYWKGYGEHEYTEYEFFTLFDSFYKEKTERAIALLERVANGEELSEEETADAMSFLHMLGGRAHALTDRGGCF